MKIKQCCEDIYGYAIEYNSSNGRFYYYFHGERLMYGMKFCPFCGKEFEIES